MPLNYNNNNRIFILRLLTIFQTSTFAEWENLQDRLECLALLLWLDLMGFPTQFSFVPPLQICSLMADKNTVA
jgi:hypothetical protein